MLNLALGRRSILSVLYRVDWKRKFLLDMDRTIAFPTCLVRRHVGFRDLCLWGLVPYCPMSEVPGPIIPSFLRFLEATRSTTNIATGSFFSSEKKDGETLPQAASIHHSYRMDTDTYLHLHKK